MFAITWTEVNRKWEVVTKMREFKTELARQKFADKLAEKDGFVEIVAWSV